MILESLITYISASIRAGMPEVMFKGLCDLLNTGDSDTPTKTIGQYNSAGEFVPVDFDSSKAIIYLRYNGQISSKEADEDFSCDVMEEMIIPLKVIFIADKSFRGDDDSTTSNNLALSLKKILTFTEPKGLLIATNLESAISRVSSIDLDWQKVAEEEGQKIDYTHTLFSLNLDLTLKGEQGCFEGCDDGNPVCLGVKIIENGEVIETVPSGGSYTVEDCRDCVDFDGINDEEPYDEECINLNIDDNCSDAVIENSDQSYQQNAFSGNTLVIPDILVTNYDGTQDSKPAAVNVISKQLSRTYAYPQPTGQVTSYATGDDADIQQTLFSNLQRGYIIPLVDFLTLDEVNIFGNINRFTDENGLQVYGNNYWIDHYTGLAWRAVNQGSATWANAILGANNASITIGANTYTDWFLPNNNQILSICEVDATLDSANSSVLVFNLGSLNLWTSTTAPNNTANACRLSTLNMTIVGAAKSGSNPYIICRKF